jgi:hypothetical protein
MKYVFLILTAILIYSNIYSAGTVMPMLAPDPSVTSLIQNLGDNEGTWLPDFKTQGDGLDVYSTFSKYGPGIRGYCLKWAYAKSRERALYCGGDHGSPHKFNDVWEYDLASNTWVMLYKPDSDVKSLHTWWGLTYDQKRDKLLWMCSACGNSCHDLCCWGSLNWPMATSLLEYDPYAQDGWKPVPASTPNPGSTMQGGTLEYIPNRDLSLWYGCEWDGEGMWSYNANINKWTKLVDLWDVYDKPNAPQSEAVITYNSVNDVLVGVLGSNIHAFDFSQNIWQSKGSGPFNAADSRSGFAYDLNNDIHLIWDRNNKIYAYHYKTNTVETINPQGGLPNENGMAMIFYHEALNVFVFYFHYISGSYRPQCWVYRYKRAETVVQETPVQVKGLEMSVKPNPFNSAVNIMVRRYAYGVRRVSLQIYNISGKLVKDFTPYASRITPYTFSWNASQHPPGIYFLQLQAGTHKITKQVTLLR